MALTKKPHKQHSFHILPFLSLLEGKKHELWLLLGNLLFPEMNL